MNCEPYLSIIVPVFNGGVFLRECLESIRLAADFCKESLEILCVDDGSTDGSSEILDEYALKDRRFRVFHQDNMGVSASRNRAICEAAGEWVGFVDCDDKVRQDWFDAACSLMRRENCSLVRQRHAYLRNGVCVLADNPDAQEIVLSGRKEIGDWGWVEFTARGFSWLCFIRLSVLRESGVRFADDVRIKEDVIFLLELLPHLGAVVQGTNTGYFYRMRDDSAWHHERRFADCEMLSRKCLALWERAQGRLEGDGSMFSARKALSRMLWDDFREWISIGDSFPDGFSRWMEFYDRFVRQNLFDETVLSRGERVLLAYLRHVRRGYGVRPFWRFVKGSARLLGLL